MWFYARVGKHTLGCKFPSSRKDVKPFPAFCTSCTEKLLGNHSDLNYSNLSGCHRSLRGLVAACRLLCALNLRSAERCPVERPMGCPDLHHLALDKIIAPLPLTARHAIRRSHHRRIYVNLTLLLSCRCYSRLSLSRALEGKAACCSSY